MGRNGEGADQNRDHLAGAEWAGPEGCGHVPATRRSVSVCSRPTRHRCDRRKTGERHHWFVWWEVHVPFQLRGAVGPALGTTTKRKT